MENNKNKILDEIDNLYGDISLSAKELDLIEKVSESDKFTNEAIELMKTQRSKYNDIIPTKENETEDILMIFSDVKNRMSNNKENNSVTKTDYNMDKILEVTNRYFEGNKEANLTDLQIKLMELLRSIAKYDDATNNLIKWLNGAIENDEERSMKNYIYEATDAYEVHIVREEAREFEQDLKKLNPDVDIKLDKECTSIDISKPISELNLPENFYLDENNRITNRKNTALSVFVSLKVNEVNNMNKDAEKDKIKIKKNKKKKRLLKRKNKNKKKKRLLKKKNKNKKKQGIKIKFSLFKRIKNFFKNKFTISEEFINEEISLDSDSDMEELDIDISNKNSSPVTVSDGEENDLDFDMEELDIDISNKNSSPVTVSDGEENDLDFDMEELDIDISNKNSSPATVSDSEENDLDFDMEELDIDIQKDEEAVETKSDKFSESHTENVDDNLYTSENKEDLAKIRRKLERIQNHKKQLTEMYIDGELERIQKYQKQLDKMYIELLILKSMGVENPTTYKKTM